ncbi:MAG: hypothetical protein NTY25_09360 [Planctomycetia bacterium]|nr:hypothetical protein [Planctomycetia bacterium]
MNRQVIFVAIQSDSVGLNDIQILHPIKESGLWVDDHTAPHFDERNRFWFDAVGLGDKRFDASNSLQQRLVDGLTIVRRHGLIVRPLSDKQNMRALLLSDEI